jgi:hypothetical protein
MICTIMAIVLISAIVYVFITRVLPKLGNNEPSNRHPD